MKKITYMPDNQFLLELFNKSEHVSHNDFKWYNAFSINDIKTKYDLDNCFLITFVLKKNISVYQYSIFMDNDRTLLEKITNKRSKGYNKYFEYFLKLDKDLFSFKRDDHSYIITFNIIEYNDSFKDIALYSFLNSHEADAIFKETNIFDNAAITEDEAVEIIKNVTSTNYNHVIPNSHMFFKLDQIIMAINRNEDLDFIKTGIQNSIKNGYEIHNNNE